MSSIESGKHPISAASAGGRPTEWFGVFAASLSLFIAALILYPLGSVIFDVFFGKGVLNLAPFRAFAAQNGLAAVFFNTAVTVGASSLIAVAIGSFFAWLNERTDIGMATVARVLPIVPLLVPPIAGAIGWVLLASPRSGFLNHWIRNGLDGWGVSLASGPLDIFTWYGLIFVYVINLVPYVYLTVAAGLRNLDPSLEEAARTAGANPWTTLVSVTFPAVKPAIVSGATLAVISGFALFSVPVIIGGQAGIEILAVRIVNLMTVGFPPQTGVALIFGAVIMAVIALSWWLQRRILRSGNFATIGGRGTKVARVRLGWFKWPLRAMLIAYLLLVSVLPLLALIIVSLQPFWSPVIDFAMLGFDNYRQVVLEDAYTRTALRNSIFLGIVGAAAGMLISAVIAFYIDRNRRLRTATFIDATTKLPGAVSHLVIGIAFVSALAGPPFYLHGTTLILFLAYIVLYMPQSTLSASNALGQVGRQLSEASLVSGASQASTFFRITLPLMAPGLMAGGTLLFVLMAGDITASSMLAGTRNPVVGFVILDLWTNSSFPPLAALAAVISIITSAVVLVSLRWTNASRP